MLFHVTQVHTPESCPKDVGGSRTLYDPNAQGVKLRAMYGAFAQHTIYYILEAESLQAVNKFLDPGWARCRGTVTPVSEEAIAR